VTIGDFVCANQGWFVFMLVVITLAVASRIEK